jgi:hypothetical protein
LGSIGCAPLYEIEGESGPWDRLRLTGRRAGARE